VVKALAFHELAPHDLGFIPNIRNHLNCIPRKFFDEQDKILMILFSRQKMGKVLDTQDLTNKR
jgi:hypothetical protein